MPEISFILPVYNVEKYIYNSLNSLQNQTVTDFEAILVDDGSTDTSGAICDKFALCDNRFKVIHKNNGGVASARNAGLDNAQGKYIFFLDPDDWIDSDTAEILTKTAEENSADIVMFGLYKDTYDKSGKLISSTVDVPDFSGVFSNEPCKTMFDKIATSHLITLKLFKRELIEKHNCRFKNYSLGEDGAFFADVYINNPDCIAVLNRPFYHYVNHTSSLSTSFHKERLEQGFVLSQSAFKAVKEWGLLDSQMHLRTLDYCVVRDLQMYIKNLSLSPDSITECCKKLRKLMKSDQISNAVKRTSINVICSKNDKIKLLLLKLKLYRAVIFISRINQNR